MKIAAVLISSLIAVEPAHCDILVPVRTIRAKELISHEDLTSKETSVPGAISDPKRIIGLEARTALFPDRPIRASDVGPPAVVERNQLVTLIFRTGGLKIETSGRSLGRAAAGEVVRVLNLSSRATLTGEVREDGTIEVQ